MTTPEFNAQLLPSYGLKQQQQDKSSSLQVVDDPEVLSVAEVSDFKIPTSTWSSPKTVRKSKKQEQDNMYRMLASEIVLGQARTQR